MYHQQRLSKKEAAIREIELKQKGARDAKLAEEKKQNEKGNHQISLIRIFST